MSSFPEEEFNLLSRELEQHHSIFNRLWKLGRPVFTNTIKTAGVYFDRIGECIDFRINEEFWNGLSLEQKKFVISHECLHVILQHGFRINLLNSRDLELANLALDVVVNHTLVDRFGFIRDEVDKNNKYCWLDTIFKDKAILKDQSYEYYFTKLRAEAEGNGENNNEGDKQNSIAGDKSGSNNQDNQDKQDKQNGEGLANKQTLDDHSGLSSFNTPDFEKALKETLEDANTGSIKEFVEKHIEDIQDIIQQAGCNPGNTYMTIKTKYVKPKQKWETVIKRWALRQMKDNDAEQWVRPSRRLASMKGDFFLPADYEIDFYEKDRIEVWFFQDTSGSCQSFAKRFFTAAKSLPQDRFSVRMFCFDTRVFETTLESGKLYGFGGTTFSCIERFIQNTIKKEKCGHPKAIFVITDGYGNMVHPEKPERWHWFLSTNYTGCIPQECLIYQLKEFE